MFVAEIEVYNDKERSISHLVYKQRGGGVRERKSPRFLGGQRRKF